VLGVQRATMFLEMGRVSAGAVDALAKASAAYFEAAIPGDAYTAWVAVPIAEPTRIIGGGGVQRRPVLPGPDKWAPDRIIDEEAHIVNIYTEPAWRRRGIAALLMRHILDWTRAEGLTRVNLHASDAGRPMYEQLGFVPTNEMRYDPTAT
jgi:GNAT superfamily N-acetyltransferase